MSLNLYFIPYVIITPRRNIDLNAIVQAVKLLKKSEKAMFVTTERKMCLRPQKVKT